MTYEPALNKAWQDIESLKAGSSFSVKFLSDEYDIDLERRKILSLACNVPAKDFVAILVLHYLFKKLKGLPKPAGEWLTFRELAGIEGYYPAFKKRSIEIVIRKYGAKPESLLSCLSRLPAREADFNDVSIIIDAFENVPVLVKVIKKDEDFGPDANILFDKSIKDIFCLEDIIVLASFVAQAI